MDGRVKDMRKLFDLDNKDYDGCTRIFQRDSARSIIIHNGLVAMVHSRKYDYYKFPGGGLEAGEDPKEAMIRETREEAGLIVREDTVKEYGYVHRIQRSNGDPAECFVQDNYYYLCEALERVTDQDLDDYEKREGYQLEFVEPAVAIRKNRRVKASPFDRLMFEREARVLELLMAEGWFKSR